MAPIEWSSFICCRDGVVDYKRIRSLVSIALAIGGAIPLILSMLGISFGESTANMSLGAGVLISPLTAGRITEAIVARKGPTPTPEEP